MINKYKVKHTSIMHNGRLYKEGSIIELSDEQAKRLEDFVDLVNESLIKKQQKNQNVKMSVKTNVETKSEPAKTKEASKKNEVPDGGANDDK